MVLRSDHPVQLRHSSVPLLSASLRSDRGSRSPDCRDRLIEGTLQAYGLRLDGSRRVMDGRNLCVFTDDGKGHPLVVKIGRGTDRDDNGALLYEGLAYLLAQRLPSLRSVMAACYLHDRRRDVLILEDLSPAKPAPTPSDEWAYRLGRALGRVHDATVNLDELPAESRPVPRLSEPPIPDLGQLTPEAYARLSPVELETVRRLQATDEVLVGLRALRRAWTVECLIHGDVSLANALILADDVWLIDWEEASAGDPAFDLAGAAAELLATGGRVAAQPLAALFAGYRSVRSTCPTVTKVVAYAGVWLVHRVTAACRRRIDLPGPDQVRLELAAAAIAQPGRLAAELGIADG